MRLEAALVAICRETLGLVPFSVARSKSINMSWFANTLFDVNSIFADILSQALS